MEESRNPDSHWRSYLDTLSESYDEFPLLWTEEDLANLDGSALKEVIAQLKTELTQDFEHIADAVPSFRYNYSLTEFLEMWLAIESR